MNYEIQASSAFPGVPQEVYDILADYRNKHPRILPGRYFSEVRVLDGGVGEGTELRLEMKAFGRVRPIWAVVTEPEPGKVILETDLLSERETWFELEQEGENVRVTIRSRITGRDGVPGLLERLLTTAYLRRVFEAELRLLAEAARPSGAFTGLPGREESTRSLSRGWRSRAKPPELSAGEVSRFVEAP